MENNLASEPLPPKKPKNLGDKIQKLKENFLLGISKIAVFLGQKFLPTLEQKSEKIFEKIGPKLKPLSSKMPAPVQDFFKKHRGKITLGLAVLLLLFFIRSCLFQPKSKIPLEEAMSQQQAAQEGPVAVKGFKIGRFNFEDSLNALGTIKGGLEFKLSFEVPGMVSSVNYREGERYEEGALLMSLRQDDILLRLKRAQAELKKAETEVQLVQDKVAEHEKLLAMGAIPKSTLEKVKLELDKVKYDGEAARLEMKANESMLEKSNLYSPTAGMIGELSVEEGEAITPNTLLGTHISTEFVYAEFGIVERDVNKIALGQKARVFVDAYPDKTFEGVIENISPVVTGTSRTATVKVRLENPERLLLPGMFCRVRILLYSKKNTLVVP
ncbi:MAG TPA: efflux RND transporter periplasmic adaptor subunit, partial [bacterium]|nr:efflux RND transporter periplasmic adaptor subunit [bacterium]